MALATGTRLGTYEILAPLGAGGMGEVYRARDTKLGREVALKVLPAAMASDPERLARFEREARTVAGLSHPNIVVLHSMEQVGDTRFLTMELVEGDGLDRHVGESVPFARVLELGVELADALTAAHDRGVIHRDLKPANVVLTREGRAPPPWSLRSPVPVTSWARCRTWRPSKSGERGRTTGATCSRWASSSTSSPQAGDRSRAILTPMSSPRSCGTHRSGSSTCVRTCRVISNAS
jgi:serine/threonine protein kinase